MCLIIVFNTKQRHLLKYKQKNMKSEFESMYRRIFMVNDLTTIFGLSNSGKTYFSYFVARMCARMYKQDTVLFITSSPFTEKRADDNLYIASDYTDGDAIKRLIYSMRNSLKFIVIDGIDFCDIDDTAAFISDIQAELKATITRRNKKINILTTKNIVQIGPDSEAAVMQNQLREAATAVMSITRRERKKTLWERIFGVFYHDIVISVIKDRFGAPLKFSLQFNSKKMAYNIISVDK
jgi:hypothetical protein